MVEDRPILSAEYHLPLLPITDPPCSAVSLRYLINLFLCRYITHNENSNDNRTLESTKSEEITYVYSTLRITLTPVFSQKLKINIQQYFLTFANRPC